ncbi:MAG: hypothetical protein ACRDFC_07490, partial [Ignavibacteria bacterium]
DIPYFLLDNKLKMVPAYASSRGEKLTNLPKFKIPFPILVVFPCLHISTKWAYSKIKNQKSKIKILNKHKEFDISRINLYSNDFEKVVFAKYPEIKSIKEKMYDFGAAFSSMSGSGSSVYSFFKKLNDLKKAEMYFKKLDYRVFRV